MKKPVTISIDQRVLDTLLALQYDRRKDRVSLSQIVQEIICRHVGLPIEWAETRKSKKAFEDTPEGREFLLKRQHAQVALQLEHQKRALMDLINSDKLNPDLLELLKNQMGEDS